MDSNYKNRLDYALKLALEHPELGILQELSFMNEVELQNAIEMMERLPSP